MLNAYHMPRQLLASEWMISSFNVVGEGIFEMLLGLVCRERRPGMKT